MAPALDASILISTYRRADLLMNTLDGLTHMDVAGLGWEVIVVDNADDPATQALCREYAHRLPLQLSVCTSPGLSASRNHGLDLARGELLLFTDDDAIPDPRWLRSMVEGSRAYPDEAVFGGRVQPSFLSPPPDVLVRNPALWPMLFAENLPDLKEGPYRLGIFHPMGPNYAITRQVFDAGMRFNTSVGSTGGDYAMGSETNLLLRLWHKGYHSVYLPSSLVYHQVREEQLNEEWVLARFHKYGRGQYHSGAYSGISGIAMRRAAAARVRSMFHTTDGQAPRLASGCIAEYLRGLTLESGRHSQPAILGDLKTDESLLPSLRAPYVYRSYPLATEPLRLNISQVQRSAAALTVLPQGDGSDGQAAKEDILEWNTGDGTIGQVWVSVGGEAESLCAEGASGSCSLPAPSRSSVRLFRLYGGEKYDTLLATAVSMSS